MSPTRRVAGVEDLEHLTCAYPDRPERGERVVEQVGRLLGRAGRIGVGAGRDQLGRLLADLLQPRFRSPSSFWV